MSKHSIGELKSLLTLSQEGKIDPLPQLVVEAIEVAIEQDKHIQSVIETCKCYTNPYTAYLDESECSWMYGREELADDILSELDKYRSV